MSNRYKGAVISATPPTTTGGEEGTASGAWTLEQQMQLQAAGLWPAQPTGPYIEEVFNTGIYSATGGSETFSILGSVNMYTKGGLVWIKARTDAVGHYLIRPVTGASSPWNQSNGNGADGNFGTSEFRVNSNNTVTMSNGNINSGGTNYASWNFAKQPKFFDIVTYTGTGSARTIAHNLGSVPGCIMIKCTSATESWAVWHNSLTNAFSVSTNYLILNGTEAQQSSSNRFNGTQITSTEFGIKGDGNVNGSGKTYVAYIFAHNAGGFGLTGTDNVISCASYTGNGSATGPVVTLGYEPQWLLIKRQSSADNWNIIDNMRGLTVGGNDANLVPNTAATEVITDIVSPTATGFQLTTTGGEFNTSGSTYIYIAIRRGPMKVPTSGTSVFAPVAYTGDSTNNRILTTGFASDAVIITKKSQSSYGREFTSTLTAYREIFANLTDAETADTAMKTANTGLSVSNTGHFQMSVNSTGETYIAEIFGRAPGFFDEVCYTGTGSATTQTHNLGAVPELVIWKRRSSTSNWRVWQASFSVNDGVYLDSTFAKDTDPNVQTAIPTATVLNLATGAYTNASGSTYVAYLFATVSGVSKVGSYTGTATTLQIDCGFTAGSRFVLIKRTDSTGDWYLWDSARGIVAGNDPYLLLNSNTAEVTNTDYVDTYSAGFEISSTAPAAINANGGTYIFLAIA